MDSSPEKIERGMRQQLEQWRHSVSATSQRLGWKIGFNMAADQQRLNLPSAMVGYLSSGRQLTPGSRYRPPAGAQLLVEAEVAILIGSDLPANAGTAQANTAITAYCAALELVDTRRSVDDDMEAILAGNLFHDSVMLAQPPLPADSFQRQQLGLSLSINQKTVRTLEEERVPQDFAPLILTVANTLAAHGEELKAGDWIISGAAAKPVPVKAGDAITLEMGTLGQLSLTIA